MIIKFKQFVDSLLEVRLSNVTTIIGTGLTFDSTEDVNFLRFKTLSKRVNNKKVRITIDWNHRIEHDLIKKLKERTDIESTSELNILIGKGIDELYEKYSNLIEELGRYAIWFSEYDFSIIIDIDYDNNKIKIITVLPSKIDYGINKTFEIKSSLI